MNSITLSELSEKIKETISSKFAVAVWIRAEINDLREKNGHCYLELIEKEQDSDRIIAKSRAIIWASMYAMLKPYFESTTGELFRAGINVMVAVTVDFSQLYGLSLNIKDIDPIFTIGELSARRIQIIRQLEEEGIADMNKQLTLANLPKRLAVISSETAAGYGDFMNQLENETHHFTFYTKLFPAIMQGNRAEESIIQALDRVFRHIEYFDAVIIIRGGGATTDLACFDSYNLAVNCVQFPIPVIAGIGHQRDLSVLDLVAHTSVKTPTAAADFLIDKMLAQENELKELTKRIATVTNNIVNEQKMYLENIKYSIKQASKTSFLRDSHLINRFALQLKSHYRRLLLQEQSRLTRLEHQIKLYNPAFLFKHGYTITTANGKRLTSVAQIAPDTQLTTHLADGNVVSRLVKVKKQ